jgi:hypothetical protein
MTGIYTNSYKDWYELYPYQNKILKDKLYSISENMCHSCLYNINSYPIAFNKMTNSLRTF